MVLSQGSSNNLNFDDLGQKGTLKSMFLPSNGLYFPFTIETLTLSTMAPWDLIDSWEGAQSARILKTSLNHHLTFKCFVYPQDALRARL